MTFSLQIRIAGEVDAHVTIIEGDCVEQMAAMPEASVDAICTDPPYGLGFMGKEWDSTFEAADMPMRRNGAQDAVNAGASRQGGRQRAGVDYQKRMARDSRAFQAWSETWAREALRVLKPGGHLLAFGGTRTYHRLACAIEDAGFEIRDTICWLYGSGFPKSLNLDGAFEGWGTALKPAHEPIVVARKPLAGTVAANVLATGCGALNVDGCRIGTGGTAGMGRWPANVVLDPEAAAMLDEQTGDVPGAVSNGKRAGTGYHENFGAMEQAPSYGDTGGPSRFFATFKHQEEPCLTPDSDGSQSLRGRRTHIESSPASTAHSAASSAPQRDTDGGGSSMSSSADGAALKSERFRYTAKASSAERNAGLDGFPEKVARDTYGDGLQGPRPHTAPDYEWQRKGARNVHPTVKPIDLMRWLVRLVTPPGGTVLDPFTGSGTTGCAAVLEGFEFVGIERESEYADIAEARIAWWSAHPDGMELVDRLEAEKTRKAVADSGQLDLLEDVA